MKEYKIINDQDLIKKSKPVIKKSKLEIKTSKPEKNKTKKEKKKSKIKIFFKYFGLFCLLNILLGSGIIVAAYYYYSKDLPKISSLKDYSPPIITKVYTDDERKIGEFYKERRIIVQLKDIPQQLKNAFIAAEDSRFYIHKGIDFVSIARAFFRNIEAGSIVQGGSTITQQVTKSFFLTPERSYKRKIKEAILAYKIDSIFSKEEILFLYLNQIYLGHGAYGVEAASENYFGKPVSELNLAQSAMIAGLPQAPSKYSPFHHYEKAKQRQIYVLNRMLDENFITNAEATEAMNTKIEIKPRRNWYIEKVPFYTEYVRQYVENKYGSDTLYNEGLQIYTSVNLEFQKSARKSVMAGLKEIDKRQGYRGPLEQIKQTEIEGYVEKLEKEYAVSPPVINDICKGVVIEVKRKYVIVRFGNLRGKIELNDMEWARKPNPKRHHRYSKIRHCGKALKVGDIVLIKLNKYDDKAKLWELSLEQEPEVQAALLCLEADTGYVKAMIGGKDFKESQFNRAIQSRRQPGSAFKPIVYAAALDRGPSLIITEDVLNKYEEIGLPEEIIHKLEELIDNEYVYKDKLLSDIEELIGAEFTLQYRDVIFENIEKIEKKYTPATVITDSAIVYKSKNRDFKWKPKNFEKHFYGDTLLIDALTLSRNVVTIKILQEIGVDYVIDYANKLGISSNINRDLSIALGSSGISLLELVRSYAVFDNQGELVEPLFITKVVDRKGKILELNLPTRQRVIERSTAYCMTSMLKNVVEEGTAKMVKKLNRPVAGKTGTTNNLMDAWFVGYTPKYVTGVWVGYDKEQTLGKGETGSHAACPIWLYYMEDILKDKPVRVFQAPDGVVFARIDSDTGLLAIPESKKTVFICFKEGTVPTKQTPRPDSINDKTDFFKKNM